MLYDCFTYFNENELLGIRLHMLAPIVDYFVIVEADHTQRGDYKGFNLDLNDARIAPYRDQIKYIQVTDLPAVHGVAQWEIEHYQRNCILRGLTSCHLDDIIMVSDLDELPDPTLLRNLQKRQVDHLLARGGCRSKIKQWLRLFTLKSSLVTTKNISDLLEYTPISVEMRLFYYFMNCESYGSWYGTVITKFKNLCVPQTLRMLNGHLPTVRGGWHFSYLGGVERIKQKVSSIVDDTPAIMAAMEKYESNDAYIRDCLRHGKDFYGRTGQEFQYHFISPDAIGLENIAAIKQAYPTFFQTH